MSSFARGERTAWVDGALARLVRDADGVERLEALLEQLTRLVEEPPGGG